MFCFNFSSHILLSATFSIFLLGTLYKFWNKWYHSSSRNALRLPIFTSTSTMLPQGTLSKQSINRCNKIHDDNSTLHSQKAALLQNSFSNFRLTFSHIASHTYSELLQKSLVSRINCNTNPDLPHCFWAYTSLSFSSLPFFTNFFPLRTFYAHEDRIN